MQRPPALLSIAFAVLLPCAARAQPAPITAVTLYPGSVAVVRTARIESGATRLVIPGVTTQFSPQSLRVDADAGIRIGQIVTQDTARTESANAAQAALEAKIQALKDQSAALDVQSEAADIVKGYLERASIDNGAERHVPVDARTLTATVAALSQAATEALGRKQQVAIRKREIDKQVEALQRDLERLQSQSREARTLTIELAAERAGSVRVSYQLGSGGWRPAYRADLDTRSSSLVLDRMAQVAQKTGEDWRNVRVTLSTAQPRQSLASPTPQPWLIGYRPPTPAGDAIEQYAPAAAPGALAPGLLGRQREDGFEPPTFQVDGSFATEFVVTTPVTLPSDGREVLLPLARESLAARQRVQVSPRLSTVAMLMAEATRPAGVWPAGHLQLYRDGSYVGATAWLPDAAEQWRLSFGRDDLMQVRLVPVKGDTGSGGLFEQRNVRRIADRITVRSAHATPVEVLVLDATPVSTAEQVKVHATHTPAPTIQSWEDRRGVVGWTRTLAPQETATIDVAYTIESPKEGTVTGLR